MRVKITSGESSEKRSALDLTPLELERVVPGARHFSLWLIPGEQDCGCLAKITQDLTSRYDAAFFEPHVTVYTGVYTQNDRLEGIVERLAKVVQPISLFVEGIEYSDSFFKTLFIRFGNDPILAVISQMLTDELRYQEHCLLQPHLSLLYKRIPDREKQEIVNELDFTKRYVRFDEVAVMRPGNLSKGWSEVGGWSVFFRRTLCGE